MFYHSRLLSEVFIASASPVKQKIRMTPTSDSFQLTNLSKFRKNR